MSRTSLMSLGVISSSNKENEFRLPCTPRTSAGSAPTYARRSSLNRATASGSASATMLCGPLSRACAPENS